MGESKKIMKMKKSFQGLPSAQRIYSLDVPIIAITGGIATGKSTVTGILRDKGLPVIDADKLVKSIYQTDEAFAFVQKKIPTAIKDNKINFSELRTIVFNDKKIKSEIEAFIYQRLPDAFLSEYRRFHAPEFIFYDIPLLFEKKMEHLFDLTVLVYCPRETQKQRLMKRDSISNELADKILNQQMDIEEKKLKSDFVIHNYGTKAELSLEIDRFLGKVFLLN